MITALPFDLSIGQGLYLAAALVVAAFVRGFTGFGFSAIFIIFAALIMNPLVLIPVVFACEIAMTAFQARGIRPHIDWGKVAMLLLGAAVAVVPAVYVMARMDEVQARLAISTLILMLSLVLLTGWQLKTVLGSKGFLSVGVLAGIANSAGVGGLPVAAFMSAQPIEAAVFRAVLIVFLTGIDLMTLPVLAMNGLVTDDTPIAIVWAFPFLGFGVWIGTMMYRRTSQQGFRKWVVLFLCLMSIMNIGRALI